MLSGLKMGNAKSKNKFRSDRVNGRKYGGKAPDGIGSSRPSFLPEFIDSCDEELMILRRTMYNNPTIFILNNLMLCVQFFGNYEEEISKVRRQPPISVHEAELNKELLPSQKHVLLPDVLQELIAKNIRFTSMRQTPTLTVETLQPVRIFVVMDNIEVTDSNYDPQYSSINDAVTYNVALRPSSHQGYVYLQRLNVMSSKRGPTNENELDLSSIAEDGDETYSDGDSMFNMKVKGGEKLLNGNEAVPSTSKTKLTQSLSNIYEESSSINEKRSRSHTNLSEGKYPEKVKERAGSLSTSDLSKVKSAKGDKSNTDSSTKSKNPRQHGRLKANKNGNRSPTSSTSSGYRSGNYAADSDSDYGYAVITKFSTLKPLKASSSGTVTTASSEIPPSCFKKVTYTRDGKRYNPKKDKRQPLNSMDRRIKVALRQYNTDVWYMDSLEFMQHFINVFINHLSRALGFEEDVVNDAKVQGSVIFCDKLHVFNYQRNTNLEPYEVIPCVSAQWPSNAQEWFYRNRTTWPANEVIERIREFGCHIIPEGFMPKRDNNVNRSIEWQVTFPAAERYLETCMSHAQLRVYLIALMLHKTFIRPVNTILGLTTSHIRNQLFWLIEEDEASRWPENRTGKYLMKLLNTLYQAISRTEPSLSDYFIRDKNHFQNIPKEHLLHTQKQLKRIIENPVMYVFSAMENIRYSPDFFPKVDYEQLLNIMTVDVLTLVNPALSKFVPRPVSKAESTNYDKDYEQSIGFWNNAKVKNQQIYGHSKKPITNRTVINPKKAHDLIIEIPITCGELKGPRLCALLEFFISHFIKMAERCHQYAANQQKLVYLNQARRLSILLSEYPRYTDCARDYIYRINSLMRRVPTVRTSHNAPETPKRNPDPPIFARPMNQRFTTELNDFTVTLPMPEETKEYELESIRNTYNYQAGTSRSVYGAISEKPEYMGIYGSKSEMSVYEQQSEDIYDNQIGRFSADEARAKDIYLSKSMTSLYADESDKGVYGSKKKKYPLRRTLEKNAYLSKSETSIYGGETVAEKYGGKKKKSLYDKLRGKTFLAKKKKKDVQIDGPHGKFGDIYGSKSETSVYDGNDSNIYAKGGDSIYGIQSESDTYGRKIEKSIYGSQTDNEVYASKSEKSVYSASTGTDTYGVKSKVSILSSQKNREIYGSKDMESIYGSRAGQDNYDGKSEKSVYGITSEKDTYGTKNKISAASSQDEGDANGNKNEESIYGSQTGQEINTGNNENSVYGTRSDNDTYGTMSEISTTSSQRESNIYVSKEKESVYGGQAGQDIHTARSEKSVYSARGGYDTYGTTSGLSTTSSQNENNSCGSKEKESIYGGSQEIYASRSEKSVYSAVSGNDIYDIRKRESFSSSHNESSIYGTKEPIYNGQLEQEIYMSKSQKSIYDTKTGNKTYDTKNAVPFSKIQSDDNIYGTNDNESIYGVHTGQEIVSTKSQESMYGTKEKESLYGGPTQKEMNSSKNEKSITSGKIEEEGTYGTKAEAVVRSSQGSKDIYGVKSEKNPIYGSITEKDIYSSKNEMSYSFKSKKENPYDTETEKSPYGSTSGRDSFISKSEDSVYGGKTGEDIYGSRSDTSIYGDRNKTKIQANKKKSSDISKSGEDIYGSRSDSSVSSVGDKRNSYRTKGNKSIYSGKSQENIYNNTEVTNGVQGMTNIYTSKPDVSNHDAKSTEEVYSSKNPKSIYGSRSKPEVQEKKKEKIYENAAKQKIYGSNTGKHLNNPSSDDIYTSRNDTLIKIDVYDTNKNGKSKSNDKTEKSQKFNDIKDIYISKEESAS
ncbi:uncharacterized protein LOC107272442 [Cephus cinctus]|uniref:Uncharacterized protein LOC107272442 n=1 Tax=Cephus cinctus TaxID=211228 RepID=A0AAJ7FRT2_CEPCN|nr:uncharacterized protein LOC107272442 [Cephus cinctus]